ncbi:NACHT domain-containing protein [Pedobacter insulae]|uniref:NACHT domain-containing protein n=1 Tax=Pedobacter insulae TaxID=414048 RepID=A0A1I3ADC2_9SPHI|nr:hypothetical protein [Pedobacter insulae]SFH48077.1 hypothetical protein SAMN04489864_11424 [Pedobacter insulae]
MLENPSLDSLRKLILIKTGLKLISPSDCKSISLSIQKELNKNISETTIKRLFGFAKTTTDFSKFTINALIEFVSNANEIAPDINFYTNDIQKIASKAKQLTNLTLQNIKSRCSVPYELTIPRKFAHFDFHDFHESNYSFTAFIAQPGYGKTILLSHLVQDVILNESGNYPNDIVCFFNAGQIFDSDTNEISLEDRIKSKIGLSPDTSLISYFENNYQKTHTRLIIILDDFAELVLNRSSKIKIFDRIIDLISSIDESNAIKIILSMRSTTWSRFFERIRHAYFLKKKWFPGSYYYLDYNSNVPPLSEKELELVVERMGFGNYEKISADLKAQLKFPFHIQWYYKLKEQFPSFNFNTNLIFYEIIDLFINEKIFKSNYATEKIFFCKQIIKRTKFSKEGNKLIKSDLMLDISVYKNAYMELLAEGILMEEKHFHNNYPIEYVRFVHPHIFEYFLFIELLELYGQNLNKNFFEYIQTEYTGNQVRFQLLQWSIRQLITIGNLKDLTNVFKIELSNYEKNYLIYFIAENLSYRSIDNPTIKGQINAQNLHKIFIKELIHFDFVDSCYRNAVECLLETVDTEENAQFYHTILAIVECLSFDKELILNRLEKMEPLKSGPNKSIFKPYEIIDLIHLKLRGISIPANNEIFLRVEALKKNEININDKNNDYPSRGNFLDYLLLVTFNVFFGTQNDLITFVNLMFDSYPKLSASKTPLSIYLINTLAIAGARTNSVNSTSEMESEISNLFEAKDQTKLTLYAQSLLLILKAQQSKNNKEYDKSICLAKEAITIFSRNNLFLYELFMYNLLITIYIETHELELANQYKYKKMMRLEDKNIPFLSLKYVDFA